MAVDYDKLPTQLGALLKVDNSLLKFWQHASFASAANHYARLLSVANGFGQSDTEEKDVYRVMTGFYRALASDLASRWAAHRSAVEGDGGFHTLLERDLPASNEKAAGGAIDYVYEDTDGQIDAIDRTGIWGALRKDMLTSGRQVLANAITFGSFAAKSGNRGVLEVTSMTGEPNAFTGTLEFECVDENVTSPKIAVRLKLTTPHPDVGEFLEAANDLTPGKSWVDHLLGVSMTLTISGLASPTEAGDDGAIFSSPTISTPKAGDMNGGVLYVRVIRQASPNDFLIEFYASSARTVKVGSATVSGTTGTVAIDKTLKNGTRFQATFDKAAAASHLGSIDDDDNDITFDIKTPREGDRWSRPVTNDEAGNFSTKLRDHRQVALPYGPAAPGSAATAALAGAGAGNVDDGTHSWKITFVSALGESEGSAKSNVVTVADKASDGKVDLSSIPTGPAGTTARKVYRTVAGDTGAWKLVGTIADNVTTTFQDNVADSSLGADVLITFDDTLAASVSV